MKTVDLNIIIAIILLCKLCMCTTDNPHQDEIEHMPGFDGRVHFRQYAGYLDTNSPRKIFYWFQESQNDPDEDPVILWIQGGPRCSGSLAAIWLHGAFLVEEDGNITANKNSWNKVANMLYIDYPAGAGFSYVEDGNFNTSDSQAVEDNIKALGDFYLKFPRFVNNPLYIFGESYGGFLSFYIAYRLSESTNLNVKGVGSGNGQMLHNKNYEPEQLNIMPHYAFSHGVMGLNDFRRSLKLCCKGMKNRTSYCPFVGNKSSHECEITYQNFMKSMTASGINVEFYDQLCPGGVKPGNPCLFRSAGAKIYYNLPQVRSALHIKPGLPKWQYCWDLSVRGQNYTYDITSVKQQVQSLVRQGKRLLLFHGDSDIFNSILFGENMAEQIGKQATSLYRPWYYPDDNGLQQVGGFTQDWGLVTFITVKGTGHMSTLLARQPEFYMVKRFVNEDPI